MDFSKLNLGIYNLLALTLPGLIMVYELWITVRGWHPFTESLNHLSGVGLSVLLVVAFGVGHLVQELGDTALKATSGPRFFRTARDDFWATTEGEIVRNAIWTDVQIGIEDVDAAFDYCLSRIGEQYGKRETFLATSDLARSFLVLALTGIAPCVRITIDTAHTTWSRLGLLIVLLAGLSSVGFLAWSRMQRFRELSEVMVFRAYLGAFGTRSTQLPTTNRSEK